jgi:hypothetical protein
MRISLKILFVGDAERITDLLADDYRGSNDLQVVRYRDVMVLVYVLPIKNLASKE